MSVSVRYFYVCGSSYVKNLLLIVFHLICQVLKIIILLVYDNALFTIMGSLIFGFKTF